MTVYLLIVLIFGHGGTPLPIHMAAFPDQAMCQKAGVWIAEKEKSHGNTTEVKCMTRDVPPPPAPVAPSTSTPPALTAPSVTVPEK